MSAQTKLREYRRKRDFKITTEPVRGNASKTGASFVVQKHDASHLHWDLRLEVDGVLASWAVPKEPPAKSGVKRLAIHVEDHPLDYGSFEGRIPPGQYGAGTVEIWDKGTYQTDVKNVAQAIRKGKLDFTLRGDRLNGDYVLIQLRGDAKENEWLFFCARPAPKLTKVKSPKGVSKAEKVELPAIVGPQLCESAKQPPSGDEWVYEVKWDGYRMLARIEGDKINCFSRNGNRLHLPEIEQSLAKLGLKKAWIDGEVVAFDEQGISRFSLTHEAIRSKKTAGLTYCVFDLMFLEGQDLRDLPLLDRKLALKEVVSGAEAALVRYSDHVEATDSKLLDPACKRGLEGLIAKRKSATYISRRTRDWIKARCEQKLSAVVGGYLPISNGAKAIGALLLGERGIEGDLVYVGRIGTGFSDAQRSELFQALERSRTKESPFSSPTNVPKAAKFVEPKIEVEAQFLEWTPSGVMRQPKLVAVLSPFQKEFHAENAEPQSVTENRSSSRILRKGAKAQSGGSKKARREMEPDMKPKTQGPKKEGWATMITSPDRVLDKVSKHTKGDLAAYSEAVAELAYPYLEDRLIALLRCPEGVSGQCFFQKHWLKGLKEGLAEFELKDEDGSDIYIRFTKPEGLRSLVQMGVVEVHPWGSLTKNLEKPDVLVFDLDPDEGVGLKRIVDAALLLKDWIEQLGLACFAKVSGGKGLHVVVPIKPELEWDQAKAFCESIARELANQFPKEFVDVASKAKRKGKIFVDYLRNGRGATAIAPYSVRARANLPVAMPIEWSDINAVKPDEFTMETALNHIKSRRQDPWEGFFDSRRSLRNALKL